MDGRWEKVLRAGANIPEVMRVRWVWDLEAAPPVPAGPPENVEVRLIPVQGVSVAAGIMAQTWKGLLTREEAVGFLRRAQGATSTQRTLLPFVAYLEGHPAGSVLVVVGGKTAQLYGGVHVFAEHRRRGLGAALLGAALRHTRRLGLHYLWVARAISDPPTPDDIAAMALYDRTGGVRRRPLVEVVYSPQCPWSAEWVASCREELRGLDVETRTYNLWDEPEKAWSLLRGSELWTGRPGALRENVFARVFVDGEMIGGGAPLPPGLVRETVGATGAPPLGAATADASPGRREVVPPTIDPAAAGVPSDSRARIPHSRVRPPLGDYASCLADLILEPLSASGPDAVPDMCLTCHPSGSRPSLPAATAGADLKKHWLGSLGLPGGFFGVGARRGESYAGIMEVYPRSVAARAGYAAGTWGDSARVLTVACVEVARGEYRQPLMEFLLEGLLTELARRAARPGAEAVSSGEAGTLAGFTDVEAVGVYGDMAGFSPYWLFDKYGFARREERVPGVSVVLSRAL